MLALALALAASPASAAPGDMAGDVAADVASGDGQWLARLEDGGQVLVIVATDTGEVAHRRALASRDHLARGGAALIALPARQSFVVALDGAPELWEIALAADAGPFHDGFVHSYESGMEEALAAEAGRFARQRIKLSAPVVALALMPGKRHAVIATRTDGTRVVIHLAVRREIAVLPPE